MKYNQFKKLYRNQIKYLILYALFFHVYGEDTIAKLPIAFTLYNENILLVNQDEIIFYDSTLTTKIQNYPLEELNQPENYIETSKTIACQFSKDYNNYILLFIKDQMFLFDKEGIKLSTKNMIFLVTTHIMI